MELSVHQNFITPTSNLLACHNTLPFFFGLDWSGEDERPTLVVVVSDGTESKESKALAFEALGVTDTLYRWDGGPLLRYFLPDLDDFDQAAGTAVLAANTYTELTVTVRTEDYAASLSFDVVAVNTAAQYGESPNLESMAGGLLSTTYLAAVGEVFYAYYWNATPGALLTFEGTATIEIPDAVVGMYRYAFEAPSVEGETVDVYVNLELVASNLVVVSETCPAYVAKYLGTDGLYRFLGFNQYHEINADTERIGTVEYIGRGTEFDAAPTRDVGMRSRRTVSLTAEMLSADALAIASDIAESPRVYIRKAGEGPWLLAQVSGRAMVRPARGGYSDIQVVATLPRNTVTML